MNKNSDNIELRLMALEQAISKQNTELSERLGKLEVKINILSYVSGVLLASGLLLVVDFVFKTL